MLFLHKRCLYVAQTSKIEWKKLNWLKCTFWFKNDSLSTFSTVLTTSRSDILKNKSVFRQANEVIQDTSSSSRVSLASIPFQIPHAGLTKFINYTGCKSHPPATSSLKGHMICSLSCDGCWFPKTHTKLQFGHMESFPYITALQIRLLPGHQFLSKVSDPEVHTYLGQNKYRNRTTSHKVSKLCVHAELYVLDYRFFSLTEPKCLPSLIRKNSWTDCLPNPFWFKPYLS